MSLTLARTSLQRLPLREQKLFEDLLRAYEIKHLSKGKKIADTILKKHPDHGETMCMKGLVMVHLGDRDNGIALIKDGMLKDLQSPLGWHVWALIQKGEQNYEEALKSYMMVLKIDKDNFNIIREVSVLQTHTRQYDALLESRIHMLRLRPYSNVHWIGVAVAYKLAGNIAEARRWLQHMDDFLRNIPTLDTEYSDLVLFHIRLLEELGEFREAFSLFEIKIKNRWLVDRPSTTECKARLLGKLMSTDTAQTETWSEVAQQCWRELIGYNPYSQDYYKGFITNAGVDLGSLTDASRSKALDILHDFSSQYPGANTPQRLALTIAEGDRFKDLAKPYIERAIRKGIPSLFCDLKKLYTNSFKFQAIQDIVENILDSNDRPDPADYLWTLYFLAQHYSFLGQYQRALDILDTTIEHTPTLPELYMTKARVLKRAGDPYGAVRAMDKAGRLDGQDRYVNTKSGKYRLQAGLIKEADNTFGMFTKKGNPIDADLLEMQAVHYFLVVGDAQRRQKKYNLALKRYSEIQKLFRVFRDDQYDFHLFSLRKKILGSYVSMLDWEDDLHSHSTYIHAMVWSARIWVQLYDDPMIIKALHPPEPCSEMSKKALNKAKKAAHKATADSPQDYDDASARKARARRNDDRGLDFVPTDDDPEGLKLLTADDPLEQANKSLLSLKELGKHDVDVNLATFDVAIRQNKYLKATQALRRAHARDSEHPEVHVRIVQLARRVAQMNDVPEQIMSVLEESVATLKPAEVSVDAFNSQYLQRHALWGSAILAVAKVSHALDAPREEVEDVLFTALGEDVPLGIEDGLAMVSFLEEIRSPRADEFRIACDGRFVLSKVFKTAEEQDLLRRSCIEPEEEKEGEVMS